MQLAPSIIDCIQPKLSALGVTHTEPPPVQRWSAFLRTAFHRLLNPRLIRADQNGAVSLLCAVMVFLVIVFGVISLNANEAIRRRIIAQNAVDSAADAAALWQARGCNLVQQLNNLHYDINRIAADIEIGATVACGISVILLALEAIPFVGEAAFFARIASCIVCDTLPVADAAQQALYKVILPVQETVVAATPILAAAIASDQAHESGADNLSESVEQYLGQLVPGSGLSFLSGLDLKIPGIYAFPLDPLSIKLYVNRKPGQGAPWVFDSTVGTIGDGLGQVGCSDMGFPEVKSTMQSLGWDGNYGWNDDVMVGNPGFMTWIAGKVQKQELSGLSGKKFRWFDGETISPDVISNLLLDGGRVSPETYETLPRIPAFIALASSQVEGEPVIPHGKANAVPRIIQVHLPNTKTADGIFIYH